MTDETKSRMTIFFADVAGSVALYDSIGDVPAHKRIVRCLDYVSSAIVDSDGRVVEVIGDGLMAAFADPNQAFEAATQIQKSLSRKSEPPLGLRIGFHSGLTAQAAGKPYGDTVNVAARMADLAKSGQAITNHQTAEELSGANRARMRVIDKVFIKGKSNAYTLHEVVWDESESTIISTLPRTAPINRRRTNASVYLKYRGQVWFLNEYSNDLMLGRGRQCGLVVDSGAASRMHAVVSCRNGMMIIRDRSTNGTFIRTFEGKRATDGIDLFIHHEEWLSDAVGVFSLGETINPKDPNLIHFRLA